MEALSEEIKNLESTGTSDDGDGQQKDVDYGLFQNSYFIALIIIIIVLSLIILKLSMIVFKKREQPPTKTSKENGIYSNVMHEIMFDSRPVTTNGDKTSDNDEFESALDKKYKNGKMSKNTYKYMKNLIKDSENLKSQGKGKR